MNKNDFYKNFYSDMKLSENEKKIMLNNIKEQLSAENTYTKKPVNKFRFFESVAATVCIVVCMVTSAVANVRDPHEKEILISNDPEPAVSDSEIAADTSDDNSDKYPEDTENHTVCSDTEAYNISDNDSKENQNTQPADITQNPNETDSKPITVTSNKPEEETKEEIPAETNVSFPEETTVAETTKATTTATGTAATTTTRVTTTTAGTTATTTTRVTTTTAGTTATTTTRVTTTTAGTTATTTTRVTTTTISSTNETTATAATTTEEITTTSEDYVEETTVEHSETTETESSTTLPEYPDETEESTTTTTVPYYYTDMLYNSKKRSFPL